MKFATVFGASLGKNSITMFPNFVSITATLESAKFNGIKLTKIKRKMAAVNILKFNIGLS
jgi:hypothetical protein